MKQTVRAIAHKDVRGNELLYLVIGEEGNQVIINIGKKTYDAINNLTTKQPTDEVRNSQKLGERRDRGGNTH